MKSEMTMIELQTLDTMRRLDGDNQRLVDHLELRDKRINDALDVLRYHEDSGPPRLWLRRAINILEGK